MLTVNADLFRIAHMCASAEETRRFYLQGVFVTPARAGGAHLVATDGPKMLVVHDAQAEGVPERGVILKADKKALAQMKRGKHVAKRTLSADVQAGQFLATLSDVFPAKADEKPVTSTVGAVMLENIDGSFPDWRRVMPTEGDQDEVPAQFDARHLGAMTDVSAELGKLYQRREVLVRVSSTDPDNPAAVSFGPDMPAFGVVMPYGGGAPVVRPAWL